MTSPTGTQVTESACKDAPFSIKPYQNSFEHVLDELGRLDLMIQREVLRRCAHTPMDPLSQLKGLVISAEEVNNLLAAEKERVSSSASDRHSRRNEIDSCAAKLHQAEEYIRRRLLLSDPSCAPLAFPQLTALAGLTTFERDCIMICLAPELDRKYEKLYAYLQDDVTRRKPCVDLVLNLLCTTTIEKAEARNAFEPHARLLRWHLLTVTDSGPDGPTPLLSRVLKLDDRIVDYLLGFRHIDARLEAIGRLVFPKDESGSVSLAEEAQSRLHRFVRSHLREPTSGRGNLVLHFHGPAGSGKFLQAEAVCRELGFPLLVVDAERIVTASQPFEELADILGREAALQPSLLCVENFDHLLADDATTRTRLKVFLNAMQASFRLTFLLGVRAWVAQGLLRPQAFVSVEFPVPDHNRRKQLWESCLGDFKQAADHVDCGTLASQFRFTPGQINDAVITAKGFSRWCMREDGRVTQEHLYAACRAQSSQQLNTLSQRIDARFTWGEIVLPDDQMAELREICNQARHRHTVFGEWGFDRKLSLGKGLNVIFSGPPGTGKTMAAEVVASDLQVALYKIDLSRVVSKYIGETEKNLDRIFREAQTSDAILFFDEADALFGKRSEVKDAHDRYANIETGYLLQKMEEYEGIAILATNIRQNMDEAFVRRMQFIVEFPFPDEEYRKRIWQVTFPQEAPIGEDVDVGVLAREVRLAGGNIKNIALAAAFTAAADGKVIKMSHLIQAARREHQKLGRSWEEIVWNA